MGHDSKLCNLLRRDVAAIFAQRFPEDELAGRAAAWAASQLGYALGDNGLGRLLLALAHTYVLESTVLCCHA